MAFHGKWWRWRESNPRPPASHWAFSERSRQEVVGGAAAAGIDGAPYPAKRPRSPAGAAYEQAPLDDARSPARGAEAGRTTLLPKQRARAEARRLFCVPALLRGSGDHGSLLPTRRPESKPFTPWCWQCRPVGRPLHCIGPPRRWDTRPRDTMDAGLLVAAGAGVSRGPPTAGRCAARAPTPVRPRARGSPGACRRACGPGRGPAAPSPSRL
jgi:hypothetical protein